MKPEDARQSRRILEVSEEAPLEEITAAYHLLKRIHGSYEGIFGGSSMEEFSLEARQDAVAEIEAAYALLRGQLAAGVSPLPSEDDMFGWPTAEAKPLPPPPVEDQPWPPPPVEAKPLPPPPVEAKPLPGPDRPALVESLPANSTALQRARAAAHFSLEDVASETCVPLAYLQAIEEEDFGGLPLGAVHVRGYLTAFVTAIGLSAEDFVPGYLQKFLAWQASRR